MPGWNPLSDRRKARLAQLAAHEGGLDTTGDPFVTAAMAGLATLGWALRPQLRRFLPSPLGLRVLDCGKPYPKDPSA